MAIDRWVPWIEPRVSINTDTTINSTTLVDLPGSEVIFTPNIDTRIFIYAAFFVRCDVVAVSGAEGILGIKLFVNSIENPAQVTYKPQSAISRDMLVGVWTADLVGNTENTIKFSAFVSTTVGSPSYVVRSPHSGFCILAMPRLYAP